MNINGIIHEQIDWDRTKKSFNLVEKEDIGELWVSFPGDSKGKRNGPFYFLDKQYETMFSEKSANCMHSDIADDKFQGENGNFTFLTEWHRNIRTSKDTLTYYALYLPEFAVPTLVEFTDPALGNRPYKKTVFRDNDRNRYVLYLDCPAVSGRFNFDLKVIFHKQTEGFETTSYSDEHTVDFYRDLNHWELFVSESDKKEIKTFFIEHNHITNHSGDVYNIKHADVAGSGAIISHNTYNQQIYNLPENTDYAELAGQLEKLRDHMLANASGIAQLKAINAVENAREGADEKDGNKVLNALSAVGRWALDAATDIGTDIAAEVIKKSLGITG